MRAQRVLLMPTTWDAAGENAMVIVASKRRLGTRAVMKASLASPGRQSTPERPGAHPACPGRRKGIFPDSGNALWIADSGFWTGGPDPIRIQDSEDSGPGGSLQSADWRNPPGSPETTGAALRPPRVGQGWRRYPVTEVLSSDEVRNQKSDTRRQKYPDFCILRSALCILNSDFACISDDQSICRRIKVGISRLFRSIASLPSLPAVRFAEGKNSISASRSETSSTLGSGSERPVAIIVTFM